MQTGALDTLFSIDFKGNLSDCTLLLLYGCDKSSKATEGGKRSLTYMSQSQAIIGGSQSRHLNRSRGRKHGGKLLSVFLRLDEQHVLYSPGPVAHEALPTVGWALFHQPFINQEKCPTDLLTGQSGGGSSSSMVHFLSMTLVFVS